MRALLLLIVFTGCVNSEPRSDKQILDFGAFTLETPSSWTKIKDRGIDSYVGKIAIDSSDFLEFDLGLYSNDLTEYQEVILGDGRKYYFNSNDTADSPMLHDSTDIADVVKSIISWDTIDGRRAKLLTPIHPGHGTTGVYFDSLWGEGKERERFNLYGTNLKPFNEKRFLKALETIKFHQNK